MAYSGGKGGEGVFQKIINQMPPHQTYIEAFLGMGSVLRAKGPALASIGIDADAAVCEMWRGDEVPGFSVICADAITWLEGRRWEGSELVYLDPPYLFETRRQNRPIYRCELEAADHQRLLAVIRRLPVPVLISGYWSAMYANELKGWRSITFQAMTRGGKTATEWLWMNYPAPVELHDYRYLGETFRDRQNIKRKVERWKSRLAKMPMLERQVLTAALAEVADAGSTKACIGGINDVVEQ